MRLTHWLAGLARQPPFSRRSTRRKRHGDVRPAVERLEDRTLLAAPHPFDLSTLDGSNGFRLDGVDAGDNFGHSVSTAGDVNGDGFDDILVGAPQADVNSEENAGETYIIFGVANGSVASLDLGALDGTNGFRLDGINSVDWSGRSVSTAGDVNGDGFADLLVGAHGSDRNGDLSGETYVVFGSGGAFAASLNLNSLNGSDGFRLDGIKGADKSGYSVKTAGDVNGDGYDDILVGAKGADPGGNSGAGETYVVFGSGGGFAASLNLDTLDGSNGFILEGIDSGDGAGSSVSTAGDVNGDGYADILVGARAADPGGDSYAGETYVVFGSGGGFAASLDLSTLDGSNGFQLDGIDMGDYFGYSVSTAGDINGDGLDDILVGAPLGDPAGETYVVFGATTGFGANLALATLDGSNGFRLNGIDFLDESGSSVSNAGDVNGDGLDDILIGARMAFVDGDGYVGETYVVFGTDDGFPAIFELSSLDGTNGFRLDGIDFPDKSGFSVSTAGDVNGDGFDDILIGAPDASPSGNNYSGETYVVFGGDFTESVTHAGTSADDTLAGDGTANVIVAGQGNDTLDGNGGADVLYAAEGDDVLLISDTGFRRVDGSHGYDTLALDASGLTLDLATIPDNRLRGIEAIDLTGTGSNTLVVSSLEVLNLSDTSNSLTVTGDADDIVYLSPEWTYDGIIQGGGNSFSVRFIDGAAELLVLVSGGIRSGLYFPDGSGPWTISLDGTDLLFTDGTRVSRLPKESTEEILIRGSDAADSVSIGPLASGVWPFFNGSVTLNLGGGDDLVDASATDIAIKLNGSGGNDTLIGGTANDTLNGGSGSDSLTGGPGDDKLKGQGHSHDTLTGGPGNDTLDGGDGFDHISEADNVNFTVTDTSLTGVGNDTLINIQLAKLFGGSDGNTIDASAFTGRAFLNGSGGNDILRGGTGYDRMFGGSGRDLIVGGEGDDVLRGQGGNHDTLVGGAGNDKLNGGAGHDNLSGGDGDDQLTGETGNDTLDGGEGADRLYERGDVDMTLTDTSLSGGLGNDGVTSIETAYLKGGNGHNLLQAVEFSGDVSLVGLGGNDTLMGGPGSDMINGRAGRDLLLGGDGNDTLLGLRDDDTLNGGAGNDWLDGGSQDDAISGWTGDDSLYGRNGFDTLVAGEGHDSLYGGAGDDILQGDDGKSDTSHSRDDDWLDGGNGLDSVRGGGGSDVILDNPSEVDENFAYWAEWVDAV